MNKLSLVIVVALVVGLSISICFNAFQYFQDRNVIQTNYEARAYYNEFGVIPSAKVNGSFTPPISMYHALQIALRTDNWNKTTLRGMIVTASLIKSDTLTNESQWTAIGGNVISPPADYSDVYDNNYIHRYVWEITINNATGITIPPIGFSLIDAATGIILPNPILF